jgi:acetyl-CoA acyltransferase
MREVAIIGASMIKFGRFADRDLAQLGAQAATEALQDAGVEMKAIEALYSGNLYSPLDPASGSSSKSARQASRW